MRQGGAAWVLAQSLRNFECAADRYSNCVHSRADGDGAPRNAGTGWMEHSGPRFLPCWSNPEPPHLRSDTPPRHASIQGRAYAALRSVGFLLGRRLAGLLLVDFCVLAANPLCAHGIQEQVNTLPRSREAWPSRTSRVWLSA